MPTSPPTEVWGVAEYGMWSTVIPSLARLGNVQDHPFAVYRPTAGKWDRVRVTTRTLDGFSLVVFQDNAGATTVLIVDPTGLLLYQETLEAGVTRESRVPISDGRMARLREIISRFQGR